MTRVDDIILEPVKVNAIVIKDIDGYTVYSTDKAGIIVSDNDEETAKEKFVEAMNMYLAVTNLDFYYEAVNADNEDMLELTKGLKTPQIEIEFTEPCQ